MKFEIGYREENKTVIVTIETAEYSGDVVYLVYENDHFMYMCSKLINLLLWARSQYSKDTFEMIKSHFQ